MNTSEKNSFSSEENNDDLTCYPLLSAGKRSHEKNGNCSIKRRRNEELIQPTTSNKVSNFYNCELSAPKKTLHGLTYQLRLLMLFVQRVPDKQEFFLATEMHEAGLFDDIVLKYQKDGVWRYRFLQAKHKNDDKYKIKKFDLFNKKELKKKSQSSKSIGDTKPYLLKKYFESYCAIKENPFFNNTHLEEFLICTNVGFADDAMIYFEYTEENDDDPILENRFHRGQIMNTNTDPVKFKLKQEKIPELKHEFEINSQNETSFLNFVMKFRFLANYEDNQLNKNMQNCLKKCLKLENVDLANAYLQSRVLEWFENYKDNESEYFCIKNKKEFLKSLNNNIESLLVAGYSNFYIEKLKSFGIQFENIFPLCEFFSRKKDNIMFIITSTPKLSIIKLTQVFNEMKLSQDEVIFTNADKLRYNKKISTTFFSEPSYKWLVIESHNEIKFTKKLFANILKMDNKKTVVIIGREDDILNFNKSWGLKAVYYHEKNNSFQDLTIASEEKILENQVLFQNETVTLNELIDINSGRKIIDALTLEKIITGNIELPSNNALTSDFLNEDYYIPRKLIERELELNILQNDTLLNNCLFFIPGANRDHLKDLGINNKWIFMWEEDKIFKNGIILSGIMECEDIFNSLCNNDTKNVCWLEYVNGKFLIMNIRNNTDIFRIHNICLEENDLDNKQILDKKVIIVADGPGAGKSLFLTKVARQLKKIMSNIWVLRINLSSYTYNRKCSKKALKSLEDIEFETSETNRAIEFIVDLVFPQEYKKINKHFVRELFTNSLYLENKNIKFPTVILLFDGFDEISPRFKEKTLTLFKTLLNSSVQIWITTRIHEDHSVKTALHSSSFFLNPLNITEKINFCKNFWKYNLLNFDNIKSKTYKAEISTYLTNLNLPHHLLTTYSHPELQALLSKIDFCGIAKHLLSYLEYVNKTPDFTNTPLQLKMVAEIMFIDKFRSLEKLRIFSLYDDFIKYKWTVFCRDKNAVGNSYIGDEFFENQLKYLTRAHQNIAFQILFSHHDNIQFGEESDKIFLSRAGLLVIHDDRLEFGHRSFAEYFVSQYFAENFDDENIQQLVFSVILTKKGNSLIRQFLNNNETFLNKLGTKTQHMIDMMRANTSELQILLQMVEEKVYNLFVKLIENFPIDFFKNAFLLNENDERNTLLHVICTGIKDDKILENILKVIKDSVSLETFNELLFKRDKQHETALHCLMFNTGRIAKALKFFECNCNSKLFYELLLQINENGKTILHIACQLGEDITCILKVTDESKESINRLLIATDNNGLTALYYAISSSNKLLLVTRLCNLIKSVCSPKIIKYLFEMENNSHNLLHTACVRNNGHNLASFLDAIKDETEIVNKLLLKTDQDGLLPLNYTLDCLTKYYMLNTMLDFVKLNCSTEMLRTLLFKGNKNGETILHSMLSKKKPRFTSWIFTSFLTYLFNLLENNTEIFYELLLKTDDDGQTVLYHCCGCWEVPNRLQEFLDFVQINCSANFLDELLPKLDNNKCSILHYVCSSFSIDNLTLLLSSIKNKTKILNDLLFQTDIKGQTALHYTSIYVDCSNMMETLLNFIKTNSLKKASKDFLCQANNSCVNILHEIAILDELILKADHKGKTILHYSVRDSEMLRFLLDFVLINCGKETFSKLVFKCDNDEYTVLHELCQNGNKEILTCFLDLVKDNTTYEEFNILLLKKDCHGKVASDYIASNDSDISLLNILLNYRSMKQS